jgi:phosphatidylglycerophosphate synthase
VSSKVSFLSLAHLPEEVPPAGYDYRCEDLSYIKPAVYRLFVNPIAARLTRRTVANDLTLLSEAFSLIPVVFALLYADSAPNWMWAVIPVLGFFGYIVLDHLDGTHARRTDTSSPLGELVDHWCDAWNGALVPFAWGLAYGLGGDVHPMVLATLAVLGAFAYCLAISEQRSEGVLKLDPMGGNEGMVLISGSLIALALFGRDQVLEAPLGYGWYVKELMWFLCGLGCVGTAKNVFLRSGARSIPDVLPLMVGSALILGWVRLGLDARLAGFMVAALSAIVSGRIVLARTTGLPVKWDGLGLVAIVLGFGASAAYPDVRSQLWAGSIVLAVLVCRAFADFGWGLAALGRWIRPGEALSLFASPRAVGPDELESDSREAKTKA